MTSSGTDEAKEGSVHTDGSRTSEPLSVKTLPFNERWLHSRSILSKQPSFFSSRLSGGGDKSGVEEGETSGCFPGAT